MAESDCGPEWRKPSDVSNGGNRRTPRMAKTDLSPFCAAPINR
jgi:hypothetical protein